ncbi:pentapeptide repeat-containing protein [Halosimplex salinum]|uniref:pentapeptide repeat-containing protein n=1 Tax=Halosimplex salinum TaxID=1710538 RepID=UPI000F48903C|nr:pentapeptide repeat-containing protein [Halosimplex salinum]
MATNDYEEIPSDRCGYTYDESTVRDIGATTCWREVWEDEDRCLWHADVDVKPRAALEDADPGDQERLDGAVLRRVSLNGVDWFEGCTLVGAELTAVDLHDASLARVDLREASLEHVAARRADFSEANLEDASLNVCDLRGTDLTGARFDQAVFSNVRISRSTTFGETVVYEDELDGLEEDSYLRSAQAAIWSYREIRDLHEGNALPIEARSYYLDEKDMRRRLAWHEGKYGTALKAEGSRWVTGYGMSHWRVLGASAALIVACAIMYPLTGGIQETAGNDTTTWSLESPEDAPPYYVALILVKSLYFSAITFSTLGYGDIRPVGAAARGVAGVESLLGSILMALLVFVLSRRIS